MLSLLLICHRLSSINQCSNKYLSPQAFQIQLNDTWYLNKVFSCLWKISDLASKLQTTDLIFIVNQRRQERKQYRAPTILASLPVQQAEQTVQCQIGVQTIAKVPPVPWPIRSTGSRIPISISLDYLSLVGLNSLVNKVDTGGEVKNIVNNHPGLCWALTRVVQLVMQILGMWTLRTEIF